MKIIIVGTAYPLRGAMAQLNSILGWHLLKRHTVEIVSFKRQYPMLLFPGKTQIDPSKPLYELPTKQLIDSINPLTWVKAARYIRSRQPDLVIFRYWLPFFAPCFGVISLLVRRGRKTGVLFICDNVVPHERRFADAALTKFAFRFADYFIVQSRSVERDLQEFVRNARYAFVPHPIYNVFGSAFPKAEARKRLGLADERIILFFGYVRRYKGLHLLLEAMPQVLKHIPVTLLIVGEFYEDEKIYRKEIQRLGLADHVIIRSQYVPNDEVALYFSACDVVVLPYISATQSGIVQIAYHFDKPVIATDVGGLAEVIIDNRTGFIVPPLDPTMLSASIVRFYQEAKESAFIKNVQQEKTKYSWDHMVEAIERLAKARAYGIP
jgi:glycosyltransferase involved in cell wall biosynthesis